NIIGQYYLIHGLHALDIKHIWCYNIPFTNFKEYTYHIILDSSSVYQGVIENIYSVNKINFHFLDSMTSYDIQVYSIEFQRYYVKLYVIHDNVIEMNLPLINIEETKTFMKLFPNIKEFNFTPVCEIQTLGNVEDL